MTLLRAKQLTSPVASALRSGPSAGQAAVWIRTAAGPKRGFGHLRRCLVLARLLRPFASCVFLAGPRDLWTEDQAAAAGFESAEFRPENVEALWSTLPPPALVLIDTRVEEGLAALVAIARARGVAVASVHDLGLSPVSSDLFIDGSLRPAVPVELPAEARVFTGPSYLVLDPVYGLLHARRGRACGPIRRVVVHLGGGDTSALFPKVIEGLRRSALTLDVVGVPGFAAWGRAELERAHVQPLRFRWATSDERVWKLLARADLVITGGGISSFEAICAGAVICPVAQDELQQLSIAELARAGACVPLGLQSELSTREVGQTIQALSGEPERRAQLIEAGRRIIDGRGAERVAELLTSLLRDRTQAVGQP